MARRIGDDERRTRLAVRHRLASGTRDGADPVAAARAVVALHATDPATVFLAAAARSVELGVGEVEAALYEDRTLVRMVGMRRTLFAVPVDVAPIVHAAASRGVAAKERKRLVQLVEQAGVTKRGDAWLTRVERATLQSITDRGEAAGGEVADDVPALRTRIVFGEGKKWQGEVALSTRVLFCLAVAGQIVRARPRGSWISGQYRWARTDAWLAGGLPELPTDDARAALARLWLAEFGPARQADLRWWTGWTVTATKAALAAVGAVEVDLDEGTGFVLPDDQEPVAPIAPWAALLPALDPTVMGWADRGWYLGPHAPALFDRNGNAGPSVWWDGRMVGGWSQRPDGEVVTRLLDDVGADGTAAVTAEAGRVEKWLGGVRITPRFRTPLEYELST